MKIVIALVLLVASALAQTTVTLNGNTYTLQSHPRVWLDGPSGALTLSLQDATNRAQSGNPAYAAMVSNLTSVLAANNCSTGANTYSGVMCPGIGVPGQGGFNMTFSTQAAFVWFAQGADPSDPNGYLAFAKYGLDHVEDLMPGGFACDETQEFCNREQYYVFNPALYSYIFQAFSLIRSQLSGAEISNFAKKVLNDNDTSHNGASGTACTKQTLTLGPGSISASGNVVTGVGTNFTSSLAVGDVIHTDNYAPWASGTMYSLGATIADSNSVVEEVTTAGTSGGSVPTWDSNWQGAGTTTDGSVVWTAIGFVSSAAVGTVYSITSDTQVILTTSQIATEYTGGPVTAQQWRYSTAWGTSNCGLIWYIKHHTYAPLLITAQSANYGTDYPPNGGAFSGTQQGSDNITQLIDKLDVVAGLALADDDADSKTLLTQSYNYFYNIGYPQYKQAFSGPQNFGGENYGLGTWNGVYETATAVRNSVVSGPDLTGGFWLSRAAPYMSYYQLAGSTDSIFPWGDAVGGIGSLGQPATLLSALMACYISSGPTGTLTSECQGFYNYYRNIRTDWNSGGSGWNSNNGVWLPQMYVFQNYNGTATAPSANQYTFKDHDITYAQCVSTWSSAVCNVNAYIGNTLSFSDQTANASQLLIKGGWYSGIDHMVIGHAGAINIWRNNAFLLEGDATAGGNGYYYSCAQQFEVSIDLNCTISGTTYAPFSRWASTDPTGDSLNRYAYTMVDLTSTYTSDGNATRVQRHIAHFKKAGAQDYIVNYDDIALSSPIAVAPKAYFHYFLNGVAPGTAISYNGTSMTISNTQANSKLNSTFINVSGSNTAALVVDNANGTYTGGNGYTFRAYMCPSSDGSTCDATKTTGEWIGVFQPINGTSGSMPTLTQLTATNFRVVQIADSTTPKVAAFAQGGLTYTSASFTSTHSGTGQYLIAGLTPGTYTATVGGSPVSGSPFTVAAGDNTVYFESSSGAVSLTQGGASNGGASIGGKAFLGGNAVVH